MAVDRSTGPSCPWRIRIRRMRSFSKALSSMPVTKKGRGRSSGESVPESLLADKSIGTNSMLRAPDWTANAAAIDMSLAPLREVLGVQPARACTEKMATAAGHPVYDMDFRNWFRPGLPIAVVIGRIADITAAGASFVARANFMCNVLVVGKYRAGWCGSGIARIAACDIGSTGVFSIPAKRALDCGYIVVENTPDGSVLSRLHKWLSSADAWPADSRDPRALFGGKRVVILASQALASKSGARDEDDVPAAIARMLLSDIPGAAQHAHVSQLLKSHIPAPLECGMRILPARYQSLPATSIPQAVSHGRALVATASETHTFAQIIHHKFSPKFSGSAAASPPEASRTVLAKNEVCTVTHAVVCSISVASDGKLVQCDEPIFVPAFSVGVFVRAIRSSELRMSVIGTRELPVVEFPGGLMLVVPNVTLEVGTFSCTEVPVRPGAHIAASERLMSWPTPQKRRESQPPSPGSRPAAAAPRERRSRPLKRLVLPSNWHSMISKH